MNKNDFLVKIEKLNFKYSKNSINLKIDNLVLPKNKIITLLGPSGSGKTTLLNLIVGFLKAKKGEIEVSSIPSEIGYIMQQHSLYEGVSAKENIYVSAKNSFSWKYNKKIKFLKTFLEKNFYFQKTITKMLVKLTSYTSEKKYKKTYWYEKLLVFKLFFYLINDLKTLLWFVHNYKLKKMFNNELISIAKQLEIEKIINKKPHELSGGEKQRVAFAKSIIKKNKIIIMDEPFSALDAKIKEQTINWLKKIKNLYNLSIVIVTHDQLDAMKISDYILILKNGELQQFDKSENLYKNPKNLFVAKFIGFPEINLMKEDEKFWYYLRSSDFNVVKTTNNKKWQIIDKKSLGDLWLYDLKIKNEDNIIKITSKEDYLNIGDFVELIYDSKKLLIFNKKNEERYYLNNE
ncbi:ATP-binding cassette domain-containing protein [Mycoplasmopsis cricetuli]|uniref:ATP-binding cassette domain-containing protein n=1 Tax=Mycoplasmopsis cricetuli TaxID=171283 RepID=UPI00046F8725|nr:ABC transporter ATP-binding protein [Mycoplasmopsis cricetuli]